MAIKKTLLIAGAVTSIGLAGALGRGVASAETNKTDPFDGLVSKIAEKFSLDQDEVQDVFDQYKEGLEAERQLRIEAELSAAVSDGELAEEQKAKILAKLDELESKAEANRDEFKDMSREERLKAMKQHHEELEDWAKENDIPDDFLRFVGPGKVHRGGLLKDSLKND